MSFNRVFILGNAGRDPEIRHFEGGGAVANFSVATSERFRDRSGNMQERTEWHNLVCRSQLVEVVEKFVRKGTQVFVEGRIRTREYTGQDGQKRTVTEIHVDSLQLVGKKSDNPASQMEGGQSYQSPYQQTTYQGQGYQGQNQNPVQNQNVAPAQSSNDLPEEPDFSAADDADDLPF